MALPTLSADEDNFADESRNLFTGPKGRPKTFPHENVRRLSDRGTWRRRMGALMERGGKAGLQRSLHNYGADDGAL